MDRLISYMEKIMALTLCLESEEKESTRGRTHTLVRREFATAATAGLNSVDGDGDQRLEAAGGEETIRRHEAAEQDTYGPRGFEEISKISPVGLYIPTLSV